MHIGHPMPPILMSCQSKCTWQSKVVPCLPPFTSVKISDASHEEDSWRKVIMLAGRVGEASSSSWLLRHSWRQWSQICFSLEVCVCRCFKVPGTQKECYFVGSLKEDYLIVFLRNRKWESVFTIRFLAGNFWFLWPFLLSGGPDFLIFISTLYTQGKSKDC